MQYPDLERRIEELKKIEFLFSKRKFQITSKKIDRLSIVINQASTNESLTHEYFELLMIFADEFSQRFDYGQEYRMQCFEEIANLMFDAATTITPSKFRKALLDLEPILVSLNQGKKTVAEIAQGLKGTDDKTYFHLLCYSYLIIVEGIFDELTRVIYFLTTLKNGREIRIEQLRKLEVYDIYKKLNPIPIILKNWVEKKTH